MGTSRIGWTGVRSIVGFACGLVGWMVAIDSASATNLVSVESKRFEPGQTACTVGVFVTNDVPIQGIVVPLEFRSTLGPGYLSVPTPTSFRFRVVPENRIGRSPLGLPSDNWPAPISVLSYYSTPYDGSLPYRFLCSGPISQTYSEAAQSADGASPDAVMYAAVSAGSPDLGEEWILPPGEDPAGTEGASFVLVFNVAEQTGCIRIDTCCVTPANHLEMVDVGSESVWPEFERGIIAIGDVVCPGSTEPSANNPPNVICKDSVVFELTDACEADLVAADVDNGSWDVEDGHNLYYLLEPAGPFRVGSTPVTLTVCDQDSKCSSCQSTVVVRSITPVTIAAARDTLVFHFSGDRTLDVRCKTVEMTVTGGCDTRTSIKSKTGILFDADIAGAWNATPYLVICVNRALASNDTNGVYAGEIVVGVDGEPSRDTIVVVVEVDHPAVPPGCDSVCGFVYLLDGAPVVDARVIAYVCDSGSGDCAQIPDVVATTDPDGAFCIETFGWPNLSLQAQAPGLASTHVAVTDCSGFPMYLYLGSGGIIFPCCYGIAPPLCVTQGFVVGPINDGSMTHVAGATVQIWDSYPDGTVLMDGITDPYGHFGLGQNSGDIVVYKRGFCPAVIADVSCGIHPEVITLDPIPFTELPGWPFFADYHSTNATFEGLAVRLGDAIYATDPQMTICGIVSVDDPGSFHIRVLGDDPNTEMDEGARSGDLITFWLNCDYAFTAAVGWENSVNFEFGAAWSGESDVWVDILPNSCPNTVDTGVIEIRSPVRGPEPADVGPIRPKIDVAVLGTPTLDAGQVDLSTVTFQGLTVLSHRLADVSSPAAMDCACPESPGPDGLVDLVLSFDQQELVESLGETVEGAAHTLALTANTKRGRSLSGSDCLTLKTGPTRISPSKGRDISTKSNFSTYPNPFNAQAVVSFSLEAEAQVRVEVFNVLGNRVASLVDEVLPAGEHRAAWNAAGLASGMYFVRLITPQGQATKKVALLR